MYDLEKNKSEKYSKKMEEDAVKTSEALSLEELTQKHLKELASVNPEAAYSIVNDGINRQLSSYLQPKSKDASVVGRAVAGGIIAGPAGAVVGAVSALDKNIKNNKNGQ